MMELTAKRVLVIAAHPDDEVLGCGATVRRLVSEGTEVHIAVLGEGLTSRGETHSKELEQLKKKCKEAANLLGAKSLTTFDLPDNRFDTVPLLDVVKIVEGL